MYHIIWSDYDNHGRIESFNCLDNFKTRLNILLNRENSDEYGTVVSGVIEGDHISYTVSKSITVEAIIRSQRHE